MAHRILVASYTNEIHSLSFDSSSLTLKAAPSTTVGFHPSWITAHPDDHSLVFACFEQDEGKVVALRYDEEGKGTVLSEASSAGGSPCSLYATKDELFVANVCESISLVLNLADTLPVYPRCRFHLFDQHPTSLHSSPANFRYAAYGIWAERRQTGSFTRSPSCSS